MTTSRLSPADLPRVCAAVKEELRTRFRPDCCIAATAILIDVLDYFRVDAGPLPVSAAVFNPRMTERIERLGMDAVTAEIERGGFPEGCWSVGIGWGHDLEPGAWAGHLVAALGGGVICDLTLDQANRPGHGIDLPATLVVQLPGGSLDGRTVSFTANGCGVSYTARPGDRTFTESPDWPAGRRHSAVVGALIRRLKAN